MTNRSQDSTTKLAEIPDKRYFTIGEVSTLCAVKPHVLRYWEQEFQVLRPSKRRGNRRYYRREDVMIIRHIKSLLYDQGYTISGARMQLVTQKTPAPPAETQNQATPEQAAAPAPKAQPASAAIIKELKEVLTILSDTA